jgi:hypothetical protein
VIDYWIPIDCLTTLALFMFYYYHREINRIKIEENKVLENRLSLAIA